MTRFPLFLAMAGTLTISAPALAEERISDEHGAPASAAIAQLADPASQQQAAMMVQAMGDILLAMPAAPLLDAARQMAGEDLAQNVDPDARVSDLIGADARDAPAKLAERIPAMMGAMASLAGAFEQLAPQLRDLAQRMPRTQ